MAAGEDPAKPARTSCAMTLRRAFRPLRPVLDKFLFAAVGEEIDGIPLSTISALTRLGLDPWQETRRISSLPRREAWLAFFVLAAAVLVSAIIHSGFMFGLGIP